MRQWISENIGNCLVIIILTYLCFLAVRSIWQSKKKGVCIGCSQGTCSGCASGKNMIAEARKAYNEDRKKAQSY